MRAQEEYRDLGDVVDLVLISANVCACCDVFVALRI